MHSLLRRACSRLPASTAMPPNSTTRHGHVPPPPPAPPPAPASPVGQSAGTSAPRNAYQATAATSDRSTRCPNRNGVWPPIYKRQWTAHPHRSQSNTAQGEWQRCVYDAVAAGELHRTTASVLMVFSRQSGNRHDDVWIAQATVAERLGLAASTVCHHVAAAKRAGWVTVQHRNRIDNGMVVGMSNMTRFELPEPWRTKLDVQRLANAARRTRDRRRQPGRHTPRRPQPNDARPSTPTRLEHAENFGAAIARLASVVDFEDGRRQVVEEFAGQPAEFYESAFNSFAEMWMTVRKNE